LTAQPFFEMTLICTMVTKIRVYGGYTNDIFILLADFDNFSSFCSLIILVERLKFIIYYLRHFFRIINGKGLQRDGKGKANDGKR